MEVSESVATAREISHRVLIRVREARLPSVAAALAFTTLLSLVPLMTVGFAILAVFPAFDAWRDQVESLLYTNLIPATSDVVSSYLQEFSGQAGTLTGLGLSVLVITALLLFSTIEDAFNDIWGVQKGRKFIQRLLLYWAMLTLGPILLVISLALTSYVGTWIIDDLIEKPGYASLWVLRALPVFLEGLGFLMMYLIIPSREVQFRFALVGALIAVVLFELAKYGFVVFIGNFDTYQVIYGALWTIPVFLVWIYLSWLVTLLGACVSAELGNSKKNPTPPPRVRPVVGGKSPRL